MNLEHLKEPFLAQLEKSAIMYKMIGMSKNENPMWLQLQAPIYEEEGEPSLLFRSSQCPVWMRVPCSEGDINIVDRDYNKAYQYFRKLKYEYLEEHHLSLFHEIKPY